MLINHYGMTILPQLRKTNQPIARFLHPIVVGPTTVNKALHHPGHVSMTDIYHTLEDGRIVELRLGRPADRDQAIWARNLTAQEKNTYFILKSLGYSDANIYNHLNQEDKDNLCWSLNTDPI